MGSSLSVKQKYSEMNQMRERAMTLLAIPEERIHKSSESLAEIEKNDYSIMTKLKETYEFDKVLGSGSSAEVISVRHRTTGKKYACKVVKRNNSMNDSRTMQTEANIMKRLDHPNIVHMHEVYESPDRLWMIMELSQGEFLEALSHCVAYNEYVVAKLFRQILLAVRYLHAKGIVHRDIKLENLLYTIEDGEYKVQLTDFGLSALTAKPSENAKDNKKFNQLKEMWGTTEYFAPEVYNRAYGYQADTWSLGCLLFELLTGEVAFGYREVDEPFIDRLLLNGGKKFPRQFETKKGWKGLSAMAKSLIKGMLKKNPVKRFDLDECINHPWFTEVTKDPIYQIQLVDSHKILTDRWNRRYARYMRLLQDFEKREERKQPSTPNTTKTNVVSSLRHPVLSHVSASANNLVAAS